MSEQQWQAEHERGGGGGGGGAVAEDDAHRQPSGEPGVEWDQQLRASLQPIVARLQAELPRLLQPELERMRTRLEQEQEQLVAPVREALTRQVQQVLVSLRGEPDWAVSRDARGRGSRAVKRGAGNQTANHAADEHATEAQPALRGAPKQRKTTKRPPLGQPPPGPPPRRPPPGPRPRRGQPAE